MVFSSATFLFTFLPVTVTVYALLKQPARDIWLLTASLLFYAWGGPVFLPVMLLSIGINYFGGMGFLLFAGSGNPARKAWLTLIIACNLLLLGYWKYSNFGVSELENFFHTDLGLPEVALPIGISFFIFQGMSYVIDCYRGTVPVQKDPLRIALYISMFPQLIAGPIVRYSDIRTQFDRRIVNADTISSGIRRFSLGLFKKAVIADNLAVCADDIFGRSPLHNTPAVAWIGILFYVLQLYFDFSGYSDMAIGAGRMLGFSFPENFRHPFISTSVSEYWRRWHISLGNWFKEYVYVPLGGSRRSGMRTIANLMIVWFLSGIWHGADWTYILFGVSFGVLICMEKLFLKKAADRLCGPGRIGRVSKQLVSHLYLILATLLIMVLFRANDLNHALAYYRSLFGLLPVRGACL